MADLVERFPTLVARAFADQVPVLIVLAVLQKDFHCDPFGLWEFAFSPGPSEVVTIAVLLCGWATASMGGIMLNYLGWSVVGGFSRWCVDLVCYFVLQDILRKLWGTGLAFQACGMREVDVRVLSKTLAPPFTVCKCRIVGTRPSSMWDIYQFYEAAMRGTEDRPDVSSHIQPAARAARTLALAFLIFAVLSRVGEVPLPHGTTCAYLSLMIGLWIVHVGIQCHIAAMILGRVWMQYSVLVPEAEASDILLQPLAVYRKIVTADGR